MAFYPSSSVRVHFNDNLALYFIHLHMAMIISEDPGVVGANYFFNEYIPDREPLILVCVCKTSTDVAGQI
jgi:hypothetical protein